MTLLELLVCVAILVIVIGLASVLARHVRQRSADRMTSEVLVEVHRSLNKYVLEVGEPPVVPALEQASPNATRASAKRNNTEWIKAMQQAGALNEQQLTKLPPWLYDGKNLLDAWGNFVVMVDSGTLGLGMTAGTASGEERAFLLSAGPDGDYFTLDDNLQSNELLREPITP